MRILKFQLALLACVVSAACTRAQPTPDDTLVVALAALPLTLDPRVAMDATGMRIDNLIFSSLVRLNGELRAEPDAAETWTTKDREYLFHLRPDLKFHNGRAVTVDDIQFSFDTYLKPGGPFASTLDNLAAVHTELVNQPVPHLVVHILLKNRSDKFLISDLPGIKILPKAEIEASPASFATSLIGTGGFRYVGQSSSEIELAAVHAASPRLIFKVIRDDFTRYQKLLKGEVDLAQAEIAPDKIAPFQQDKEHFQVYLYPGLTMSYLLINFRDPWLKQLSVRQALNLAIERDEIIRYKLYGQGQAATSILTPINPYFNRALVNPQSNLAEAQRIIESVGAREQELTLKTSNTPSAIDNGKVLAHQMSRTGLKIKTQSYEWSTFYSDVKRGNFQLATMRWVGTLDPEIYRMAFHSKEVPPGRNRGSYANPELDRLLELGTKAEDVEQRKSLFMDVQKIVHNDLAVIPLWYDGQVAIAKVEVKDYHPEPSGDFWPLLKAHKIRAAKGAP